MTHVANIGDGTVVVRLGRSDWQVVDAHALPSDPARLLGFIERLGRNRFEVLWMCEPPRWAYVESLRFAVDALVDTARFAGPVEFTRRNGVPRLRALTIRRQRRRTAPTQERQNVG